MRKIDQLLRLVGEDKTLPKIAKVPTQSGEIYIDLLKEQKENSIVIVYKSVDEEVEIGMELQDPNKLLCDVIKGNKEFAKKITDKITTYYKGDLEIVMIG